MAIYSLASSLSRLELVQSHLFLIIDNKIRGADEAITHQISEQLQAMQQVVMGHETYYQPATNYHFN